MFSGIYEHSIDEKGRISLPAKLRDLCLPADQNSVVLTTSISGPCLQLYTKEAWDRLLGQIAAKPQFSKAVIIFKRNFVAPAMECQPDSHGRIVIPPVLRQFGNFSKEVLWVGMIDSLELWDKAAYYQWRQDNPLSAEELNDIAELGL